MCKRFEDGLNKDIKLLVGILELKEFVVLVDRSHKAEELSKEKRHAEFEIRDSSKRLTGNSYQLASKKSKEHHYRSTTSVGYSSYGECRVKSGACFKCGSLDHYLRDFPKKSEKEKAQTMRPSNTATRGRSPRNPKNVSGSCGVEKDSAMRSKERKLARAYVTRAREDTFTLDVITGTFSIYDTDVIALIDPGSTYSYVCTNLVSSKNLAIESTEFVVKVSNPLGQYVLADKVCKNCPLMTWGYSFFWLI
ncbi:uncharacterized protein LOC105763744 [Gossypium raimondii]|uniref:uncharacterized protein LOC105763744 n=1 Tax=Gossypium raimondii TaxID=29730 RepID=UPI00063ABAF4|nr:uncharacterized protein LOC105763744 [Gossypium raimondii]